MIDFNIVSNTSKKCAVDQFYDLFKTYDFFDKLQNVKVAPRFIVCQHESVAIKIELVMGIIDVRINSKLVASLEYDEVNSTLVNIIVEKLISKLQ